MEQPTNGLNATTAYDLACRYNSLFQYNPSAAAAAACAAAYGMFNNTSVKTQSQTSPSLNTTSFQSINTIATSSIPSSSSSNIASSPTSSLSSLTSSSSNNLVQKNIINSATNEKDIKETKVEQDSKKEFDTVSENSSVSEHFDDDVHNSTCNENDEDQTGLNESEKNDNISRTRLSSQSEAEQNDDMIENNISNNNNSKVDDEYEIEMSKIQQKLSSDAEKSINSCLNQTCNDLEENYEHDDEPQEDEEEGLISNNEDDESPKKRQCLSLDDANTANNQNETINNSSTATTLTSMMLNIKNNIQKKRSSEEIDCNNMSRNNNHNKNNFCLKLNQIDYLNLRKNLIQSVNQAIELTLESFYESKQNLNQNTTQLNNKQINGNLTQKNMTNFKKFNSNQQQQSVQPIHPPKRIRVNEKISKHASTNFNVSKILSKDNINPKRKFMPLPALPNPTSLTHHQIKTEPNNLLKPSIHHSASSQSLQNESLTSNLSAFQNKAPQSTSLLTTNQKSQQLSHFYSAAMSHLHQNSGQASNFNYSHLINPSSNQVPPQASFFNQNQHLSTQIPSSASSSSNGIISSSGSSSSSTTSISNPPGSISSLFAAHQHQILIAAAQAAANGQNPNYLQMAAAANRLFNPYILEQHQQQNSSQTQASSTTVNRPLIGQVQSSQSNFFHNSPHKRRRTKVTDTRLSPRNPALLRNNLIASSLIGMSLNKNRNGDESPLNEQDDDQDNFINQDYDEEQQQNNQDDDSASSGCNESGSTAGSTAGLNGQSMSNGFGNSNSYMNEMNGESQTSEYNGYQTSTLSSLHLRKAKLMFFFTRYPSSTILRNFFPDVKFNKANTAQLVKWFSNFREFFYIQMEKYARQHLAEGIRNAEEILVDCDSEIFRALNSHYNRNNQLEIPASFSYVIQATLREFFKAIQESKDLDPSWKKAIYKVIARMDDQIPEYFKSVQWMESLETNI